MRILLAAEESAGARCLAAARASRHQLLGVLTSSPEGTVGREAARHGVPLLDARQLKDPAFASQVRAMDAEVLLNVHSLYLIKAAVLESFSFGCFNLHPGPLPDYAGMNAPSWALLNGEARHGVTLHWMSAGIDEGYIAYQQLFELVEKDTGFSVSMRCVTLGLELLGQLLAQLEHQPAGVPRLAQDLSRRRYFGREKPHGGRVPLTMTAAELVRFVRASDYSPFASPWGHPLAMIGGRDVGLVSARETGHPLDGATQPGDATLRDGELWLAAADAWVGLRRVTVDGKGADPLTLAGA